MRYDVPQAWLRAIRAGRSARWIARELLGDEAEWRQVHRLLMSCGGYRVP